MDEFKFQMNSPEFRKQVSEAATQANRAVLNSPEFKRQMEEINRKVNSPEFRAQIEQSKTLAIETHAHHSAEAHNQLEEASAAIAKAKKQVHNDAIQRQLEQAQRNIDKASKTF